MQPDVESERRGDSTARAAIDAVEYLQRRAYGTHLDGSRLHVCKSIRDPLGLPGHVGAWCPCPLGVTLFRHVQWWETSMKACDPKQDWGRRGFSCDIWTDAPGQVWRDFVHATDELVMPLEGEIELEVGGRICRPRIGEEVVIPAGVRHTVRNVGSCVSRWYYGYRRE